MTNSLIPYSFVPGTKAKAQEVNANFIALAEQIQNNNTNIAGQLTELEDSINTNIENISKELVDTDLIKTKSFTNTILEAPNGVAEYESGTITVKSGVKVLIPNGRDSNNKLESIEYTTDEPITRTITNLADIDTTVFLYNNGTIEIVPQKYILYKNTTPTTLENNVHWYNTDENQWYRYILAETRWEEVAAVPIASAVWDSNNIISALTTSKPINLVKVTDLDNFYTLKGILPKDIDYVVKRYKSDFGFYELYKSGWVRQGGYTSGNGDSLVSFYIKMKTLDFMPLVSRRSEVSTTATAIVWVRELSYYYMKVYSNASTSKHWCVEGYADIENEV